MRTQQFIPLTLVSAGVLALAACGTTDSQTAARVRDIGWTELAGLQMTAELPSVNRIELNRITAAADLVVSISGRPLQASGPLPLKMLAGKTLAGAEAAQFLGAWRTLHTGWSFSGLCHEPAYQLRFFHDVRLVAETSVCYQCQNFSVHTPDGWRYCGFDTQNEAGKRVFNLLTNHVPLAAGAAK